MVPARRNVVLPERVAMPHLNQTVEASRHCLSKAGDHLHQIARSDMRLGGLHVLRSRTDHQA
jgi:hypothetical protein